MISNATFPKARLQRFGGNLHRQAHGQTAKGKSISSGELELKRIRANPCYPVVDAVIRLDTKLFLCMHKPQSHVATMLVRQASKMLEAWSRVCYTLLSDERKKPTRGDQSILGEELRNAR